MNNIYNYYVFMVDLFLSSCCLINSYHTLNETNEEID